VKGYFKVEVFDWNEGFTVQLWFFISIIGFIAIIPPYYRSVEHSKLEENMAEKKEKESAKC